jgi:O-antigen ligase
MSLAMNSLEMAPAGDAITGFRLRLAEGLWRAASAALALMPVGMAIAHRSSPVFLVASAVFSLGAAAAEGRLRQVLREGFAALASPLGAAVLAFLAWSLVSVGWSEFKAASLLAFGEFWLPVAAAFVLSHTLAWRMTRSGFWLLAGAFVLACAMMVFELRTGLSLRRTLGLRSNTFIFNRTVLTLLVLTPPLVAWLLGHARYGWLWAAALVAILCGTALASDSGAAVLGLFVAGLVFPAAWFAPRLVRGAAAVAFAVALIAAPLIGPVGRDLIPASLHQRMAQGHSRERVDLWLSFGAAVREQPFLGAGFGVSPRIALTSVAQKVPKEQRTMLAIGHPHNASLQIWVELGAMGVALALAVVLTLLCTVACEPRLMASASMALIAGAATVALVGHGAWQGWWAASLGGAILWMLASTRTRPETKP